MLAFFVMSGVRMVKCNLAYVVFSAVTLAGCASQSTSILRSPSTSSSTSTSTAPSTAPEAATGYTEKIGVVAKKFMIASANPLATDAGYQMLKAGGSAIDAAIAAQMVLTLVEPQSSGIGGGGFLMAFDGVSVKAYDGRETAPASATEKLFLNAAGQPLAFHDGVVGGRSVGTPGLLRMLELAHRQDGKLPWAALFGPAIKLADDGFAVSPRLASLLDGEQFLQRDATAAAYFYGKEGKPWKAGHVLKNPALASVLREVAAGGAEVFYTGRVARDIAAKVQGHPTNPGGLTIADLAGYQAKVRAPVCSDYRSWTVCGMPPPSSGGIAIAQMLGMLEARDMRAYAPTEGVLNAEGVHLFAEAGRLAYADRARYVADTDFVSLPGGSVRPLLDKQYLAARGALIGEKSIGIAWPGQPQATMLAQGTDTSPEFNATSHISVVDAQGHAVAMTTSIENQFGSRQMVDGFLLNNQLTDFSFDGADENGPIANRVQGGKRPRSAMSPTFVFEKGSRKLVLSIGSPGGSAIINYVAKVLVGMMDWGLDVQQSISLPNFGSRNGPTELEQGRVSAALVTALKAKGHSVRIMEQTSGLQGIMRMNVRGEDVWFGGADPRREGTVKGD
jgi:gamma-glutamyltranspeptidase/glutathione hydrolase